MAAQPAAPSVPDYNIYLSGAIFINSFSDLTHLLVWNEVHYKFKFRDAQEKCLRIPHSIVNTEFIIYLMQRDFALMPYSWQFWLSFTILRPLRRANS